MSLLLTEHYHELMRSFGFMYASYDLIYRGINGPNAIILHHQRFRALKLRKTLLKEIACRRPMGCRVYLTLELR
jgi:hypothetical protein